MLSHTSAALSTKFAGHLAQLLRYGVVGLTALCADYSTMILLIDIAGFHYLLSATIGFLLGLAVNYNLAIRFVFKKSKLKDKRVEFTLFAIIGIGGLILTTGLMWLFTDCLSLHYTHSKLISVILVFFWNFYARKLILFHN